ncbi:Xin actin-binding repeat-containing [Brachionus plicatilis]|uniref:Xin actin-binding repeat-containing n=1 Tax=Brachionus plicatilis TaxID=10195 RepID=A0A3M7SUS6_BRAPC|nr:Xin actin-binding repeat-containing [Brachionus plicatilis]
MSNNHLKSPVLRQKICLHRLGNFSSIKQTLYCTPHFLQLFARNGNYDEGFGLENYKRKWLPSQQNAQTTAAN